MTQRTLTIIKPDSVEKGNTGKIIAHLESEGFRIVAGRFMHLTEAQARAFYAVHKERPFYNDLVAYMTSGPVWPLALEREDAVTYLRQVMDKFDDSIVLASAAYNAGPHRVRRWLPEQGSRTAVSWVATIPYQETRKYVQRVLAYAAIYDWRMEQPVTKLKQRMQGILGAAPHEDNGS